MNTGRMLSSIGLAAAVVIAAGCAGTTPVTTMPNDEKSTVTPRQDSAGQPQPAPTVAAPKSPSPQSNDVDRTGAGADEGQSADGRGTSAEGRAAPSGTRSSGVVGPSETEPKPRPVPSSSASGSGVGASQAPKQDPATVTPANNATAVDVAVLSPPTTGASRPANSPLGAGSGGNAAARSVDAGWGPAPTKVGELGVVKPATRPIDIDPTLVDAIKLPDGDPRKEVIGIWEQVNGGNDPDFAHGDYSKSVLTFRNDGVLDIARFYGPRGEVRVNRQLVFRIEGGKLVLTTTQGVDAVATDLPLAAGPNGTTIVARKPKSALPAKLDYSAKQDILSAAGRSYKRLQPVVAPNPQ